MVQRRNGLSISVAGLKQIVLIHAKICCCCCVVVDVVAVDAMAVDVMAEGVGDHKDTQFTNKGKPTVDSSLIIWCMIKR